MTLTNKYAHAIMKQKKPKTEYLRGLSVFVFIVIKLGMGRTWEKFSSLPAKKPQKCQTATGKENF